MEDLVGHRKAPGFCSSFMVNDHLAEEKNNKIYIL